LSVVIYSTLCSFAILQIGSAFGQNVTHDGSSDKAGMFEPVAGQHITPSISELTEREVEAIRPEAAFWQTGKGSATLPVTV
jgi:hypothetical protein